MDPLSIARYGMMAAETSLTASAQRIAGGGDVDYASEAVSQIEAKTQFSASAKVVSIADKMWKSLLDTQSN